MWNLFHEPIAVHKWTLHTERWDSLVCLCLMLLMVEAGMLLTFEVSNPCCALQDVYITESAQLPTLACQGSLALIWRHGLNGRKLRSFPSLSENGSRNKSKAYTMVTMMFCLQGCGWTISLTFLNGHQTVTTSDWFIAVEVQVSTYWVLSCIHKYGVL